MYSAEITLTFEEDNGPEQTGNRQIIHVRRVSG
jgi:hypothetical protein